MVKFHDFHSPKYNFTLSQFYDNYCHLIVKLLLIDSETVIQIFLNYVLTQIFDNFCEKQ